MFKYTTTAVNKRYVETKFLLMSGQILCSFDWRLKKKLQKDFQLNVFCVR